MTGTDVVVRNSIQMVTKTTSQTKLFVLITIRLRFRSSRRVWDLGFEPVKSTVHIGLVISLIIVPV